MKKVEKTLIFADRAGSGYFVSDPIYSQFKIDKPFSDILETKEFQRLKDITQTGFSFYDFPYLQYEDRFGHSLGAFYIMERILEKLSKLLEGTGISISKDERDIALAAILLHDIGHGPFSHSFEIISNYSHEKRTTDILLGDTEVNAVLVRNFGEAKTRKIASFIAEIDASNSDLEFQETNFTRLIKSLISHQIDADRLDYLVRDAFYSEIETAINVDKIIDSIDLFLNENGEYEVIVNKKNLTLIETPLIERFQHYRDLYFTTSSIVGDRIFRSVLLEIRKSNEGYVLNKVTPEFRKLVFNAEKLKLDEFLELTDYVVLENLSIIKDFTENVALKKMCDIPKCIESYFIFEDMFARNELEEMLSRVTGLPKNELAFDDSIYEIYSKTKFYKKDEGFKIKARSSIVDLTDVTNLVNAKDYVEVKCTAFSFEIFYHQNHIGRKSGISEREFDKLVHKEVKQILKRNQETN